tara:strand:- start:5345 stop:6151 length:807 start_codon:yes stop_codon:yes gene_type:complete
MMDEQNTPGSGLNGEHVVYSNFFRDNHIVQQTAIVHPKTLLIDGLRKIFRNDSIFTYRDDEYGFPLTPDQTGIDIDSEYTTKILISDTFRYEVKFFPAIVIKANGGSYKPVSFNQNMTYKYKSQAIQNDYGATKIVSTPTHRIYAGMWDLTFEVQLYSESQSELQELVDITSIALQYALWNDLRASGLFIKSLQIGAESSEQYANDYIYSTSITIGTISEWRVEIPIQNVVEKMVFKFQPSLTPIPGQKTAADVLSTKFSDIIEMTNI